MMMDPRIPESWKRVAKKGFVEFDGILSSSAPPRTPLFRCAVEIVGVEIDRNGEREREEERDKV